MIRNNKNTDKIIRDKFEHYAPIPPQHIWAGIENGLNLKPVIPFYKNRMVIAISVLVLLSILALTIIIKPISNNSALAINGQSSSVKEDMSLVSNNNESDDINVAEEELLGVANSDEIKPTIFIVENHDVDEEPIVAEKAINKIINVKLPSTTEESITETTLQSKRANGINIIKLKKSALVSAEDYNNEFVLEPTTQENSLSTVEILQPKIVNTNSHWKIAGYLSPEIAISELDSVEILNSYTFSIEPTYTFNSNWFVRSGVGLSYVRDRGFAEINYISNDYIGSYDDVYNITFDTISGIVTPIYHTKTVEVWDSVHHVTVSNVTNKYAYLQVPLLIGYTFKNKRSNINWCLMGGPAVSFKISSWIDNPKPEDKDAEIISLNNNLPIRSNSYLQLWIGAGLEYQLNSKFSFAVEPIYRYYLKSIYNNSYNSTSSAGLTLRVGLVYKIK